MATTVPVTMEGLTGNGITGSQHSKCLSSFFFVCYNTVWVSLIVKIMYLLLRVRKLPIQNQRA